MPNLALHARQKKPSLTRRARHLADNARDRFLDAQSLVQAQLTPFEVIHEQDIVRLRYYPPLQEDSIRVNGEQVAVRPQPLPVPLVLVAPLAVNMLIYDLFPERSLVRYLRARGFELYLIDWGRPGRRHDSLHLSDYYAGMMPGLLEKVRQHSGQRKLSLHGWSFGGLFSLCYTALGDPDIENLALIGAPLDYHRNGALGRQYQFLSRQVRALEKRTGLRVHRTSKRLWRSPGWMNSLMFKLTNPVGSMQGYVDLLKNLHNREYVKTHATQGAFLDDMVAYPGGVVQDIIQFLWVDNVLAHNRLPQLESKQGFDGVKASLLLVTGRDDPIVTEQCSMPIMDLVSSEDKTHLRVPGGHVAILGGSGAPQAIWPQVADWLEARSVTLTL
ncbi:alpha/beta fold hydrolase [Alcanivorax sp. 1008]|uniref:alpha/beta fold hydrolase n=1 Tax=Alcanivorax sp. 1008 TaxID=2816853 RepID=UPI001DC234CC|nr:alpha/beta fold hydrolase [Alcanivorax sp. 1008]MCC1498139.1 alpha/beta fold hydrolase [Alcanivorax sp. 1008]